MSHPIDSSSAGPFPRDGFAKLPGKAGQDPARTALIILLFVNLLGYVDRAAINILQIPIKIELGLSDSQIGILIGFAFFVPYVIAAPPIARLADRSNRRSIIVTGVSFWSFMTGLNGLMSSFAGLLLCRMGVATGEAAGSPSAISIVSDYYPASRRGRAIGIYSLSVPLGSMVGIGLSGALAPIVGWRNVFIILGVGGLIFAGVILLLLREPKRTADYGRHVDKGGLHATRVLWRSKTFRYLTIGATLHMFTLYSLQSWNAPFYDRVHHIPLAEVALYLSLATGGGGVIGSVGGGYISDYLGRGDLRWYAWVPAISSLLLVPAATLQLFVPWFELSMVFAFIAAVMLSAYLAPMMALTQIVVRGNLRAFAVSITMVITSLFGGIFGPLVSGLLSDLLMTMGQGPMALRNAMLVSLIFPLFAAASYVISARHVLVEAALFRDLQMDSSEG